MHPLLLPVLFLATTAPAGVASVSMPAPLKLPPISEDVLPNGLQLVTARRAELPLVAIRLVLPTGSARDPKGKEGLASFTADLLRRGTKTRSADKIDDAIESLGGMLGAGGGVEQSSISATVPSDYLEQALEVIADLARNPAFPQKEFDSAKRRELAQLQGDLDDPSGLADRALVEWVYGKDHPYGHSASGSTASVKKFKRDDVVKFHKDTFGPDGSLLVIVGDVDPAAAKKISEKVFGTWKGAKLEPLKVAWPKAADGLEILLVDKADATQAQVRISVPGIARKDPAFHATSLANTILGGGFTSRLVDEVRVNRGLSYSVSTRLIALREIGVISYSTFTKSETVKDLFDVSFDVFEKFRATGPTTDELDKARRYVIGLYPGRVESIDALAEALANARFQNLSFDTIAKYRDDVAAVTPAQAVAAAKKFPGRASAKIVVVASAAKILSQIKDLGKVTVRKSGEFE